MMRWQRHQLNHMQAICTSLQTDNHASTSSLSFLRARCFLPTNQQRQSTEGRRRKLHTVENFHSTSVSVLSQKGCICINVRKSKSPVSFQYQSNTYSSNAPVFPIKWIFSQSTNMSNLLSWIVTLHMYGIILTERMRQTDRKRDRQIDDLYFLLWKHSA